MAPHNGRVELVPSGRGGTKAKYRGHTFTHSRTYGTRYHWRCDVRGCPSRLTTDEYDKGHMVFAATSHDEDKHRRAEISKEKRRSEATHKQRPSKRIKGYDYVKEKETHGTQCWRCQFVKCPGRCRTDRKGRVVAGPSPHSAEVHGTRSTAAGDIGTPTTLERNKPPRRIDDLRNSTERTSQEPLLLQNQEKQEERQTPKEQLQEKTKEEQRKQKQAELAADARGTTASCSSSMNQATAGPNQEAVDATFDNVSYFDVLSFEVDDMDDAEDNVSHSSSGSECGDAVENDDKFSHLSTDNKDEDDVDVYDDQSYMTTENVVNGRSQTESGDNQRLRKNVMELTCDNPELNLRAGVLFQMRRLLEAETQLAKKRRQVEILRESILDRQLKKLGSLRVHSQPEK